MPGTGEERPERVEEQLEEERDLEGAFRRRGGGGAGIGVGEGIGGK